jgi:hypothetical protein
MLDTIHRMECKFLLHPYFEYRLLTAARTRGEILPTTVSTAAPARMSQAITSGFLYPGDSTWAKTPGFCHLKLHGTSVLPPTRGTSSAGFTSEQLFKLPAHTRLSILSHSEIAQQDPPVLLPWEIISSEGKMLNETEFETAVGQNWQHRSMYPLFRDLWQRAREDIQAADKISFVGLSLGPFIEPELRFLFSEKKDIIQCVVAKPEHKNYRHYPEFHSRTPSGKVLDLFQKICPGLCCNRSDSEAGCLLPERQGELESSSLNCRSASEITARDDFADFIKNEL